MTHVLFALFDRSEPAAVAIRALRQIKRDYPTSSMDLSFHRGQIDGEKIPVSSTNGRRRLFFGVVSGIFFGALVGLVFNLLGFATASLSAAIVFSAGMGALIGGLGGALSGVGSPDDALEKLSNDLNGGGVAISFKTSDGAFFERAQGIFTETGARIEQRTAI